MKRGMIGVVSARFGMFGVLNACALIAALLAITGCLGPSASETSWLKPGGRALSYMPEGGSDIYNYAWQQGCNSGLSIYGHVFQKHFYTYQRDIRMDGYKYGDDRDLFNGRELTKEDIAVYNAVWPRLYFACRHYVVGQMKGAGRTNMQPYVPGQDGFMKLNGLDSIYELKAWGSGGDGSTIANW